jgi:hypothetical protein
MSLAVPVALGAQSVRVSGTTWAQLIDLRPLRIDSVPIASTVVNAAGERTTAEGQPVRCGGTGAFCQLLASGERVTASPIMQDLEFSGWGLGEGISVHAHLRGRETLGGSPLNWPRANDRFDALDAYVNIERERLRIRVGRQWTGGALGLYNFDGAALSIRRGSWSIEGIGGSSLVAGLNETHVGGALQELDDLPPDQRAWMIGARARLRPDARTSVSAEYQRTLRSDRGGLYAERASVAASTRLMGFGLDAEWTEDLLTSTLNEGRLRVQRSFPKGHTGIVALRRSRPFFELWSIWGAFSPVAFDEATGMVRKMFSGGRLLTSVGGAYRKYDAAKAGLAIAPLRDDGWRSTVSATFRRDEHLAFSGDYAIDIGPGASRSDGSFGADWTTERVSLGGAVSALQSIYEYRLGTGRMFGASVHGSYRVSAETRVAGDVAWYGHRLTESSLGTDWGQRRASLRFEWSVGRDPGVFRRPGTRQERAR